MGVILYQASDFAVLAKPSGLETHRFVALVFETIWDAFADAAGLVNPKFDKPCAVHQLDLATSGCLVVGLRSTARRRLSNAFADRLVKKEYLAIVRGAMAVGARGVIDIPLKHTRTQANGGSYSVVSADWENGKDAETHYKVLASDGRYSCLSLKPVTGRTHQLRVHCASLGYPIIGDDRYNTQKPRTDSPMCLHAFRIEVASPSVQFSAQAPLPPHMLPHMKNMGLSLDTFEAG